MHDCTTIEKALDVARRLNWSPVLYDGKWAIEVPASDHCVAWRIHDIDGNIFLRDDPIQALAEAEEFKAKQVRNG